MIMDWNSVATGATRPILVTRPVFFSYRDSNFRIGKLHAIVKCIPWFLKLYKGHLPAVPQTYFGMAIPVN